MTPELLQAYQRLGSEVPRVFALRQASSVQEVLDQVRAAGDFEMTDDDLIWGLGSCNDQILNLDPEQLFPHWLPYAYDRRTRSLQWCLATGLPKQPFHDEYVSHCRQSLVSNTLVRPTTSLECLLAAGKLAAYAEPAGFIFHLSRCGSTLLSGCLSEVDNTCVLSESLALTELLLDDSLTGDELSSRVPALIDFQAGIFAPKTIVKWNAWDIYRWRLLRQIYPHVPVVLLVRNPIEILASHHRAPGRHMAVDPSLASVNPVFAAPPEAKNPTRRQADVLESLMRKMLSICNEPGVKLVDYTELNEDQLADITAHLRLTLDAGAWSRVRQRMTCHSKSPGQPFQADGKTKQDKFSTGDRQRIWRQLGPLYQQLIAEASSARGFNGGRAADARTASQSF